MQFNLITLTLIIVSALYLTAGFLAIPLFRSHNSPGLKVWISSAVIAAIGAILFLIRFIQLDESMVMIGTDPLLIFSQFVRFLGALGMLQFLRHLLNPTLRIRTKKDFLFAILYLLVPVTFIAKIISPLFIPNFVVQILVLIFIFFFISTINELKKISDNESYLLPLINSVLILLIVGTVIDLSLFFIGTKITIEGVLSSDIFSFSRELLISLRSLGTAIAFTLGFIYWVQNYSDLALKNKLNNLRIVSLLEDKKLLINNLINQKILLESGGMALGLAHELNQYLGSVRLNVEQLIHVAKTEQSSPSQKLLLERILHANESAAAIIRNLRKLFNSSFHNSQSNLETIELDRLVIDTVALYQDRLKKSLIVLELNLVSIDNISSNDSLIRQVIVNLISNSIEALDTISQENKRIAITLSESSGIIALDFFDNGPGIHEASIKNLFHLFQTNKVGGNGIGLWLSNHIVESLGGRLTLRSANPGNVVFRVQFSVEKP